MSHFGTVGLEGREPNLCCRSAADEKTAARAVRDCLSITGFSGLFISARTIIGCPLDEGMSLGSCLFTGDLEFNHTMVNKK